MLRACLHSLDPERQQTPLEIIVVDNASTDGAADMVARCYSQVTLIRNAANVGFARANNQAACAARGRYLFFLNNDTLVPPRALRQLLDYARAHPEAGVIGPRLRDGHGRPQTSFRARPSVGALLHRLTLFRWTGLFRRAYQRYRGRDDDFETTRPVEVLMGAALLVRRSLFFEIGSWDEEYTFGGEDIDLCTRIARRSAVLYHPGVEITHYGRASSRRHIGYVHTHTIAGITRYLRKSGSTRASLWFYKAALTVDAPLQWCALVVQYLWRRVRRQPHKAAKCLVALRGAAHFLRHGLSALWRA
jgi:N-acetylglucosaminyl-diphospho-decaprenol L-rhamnosyltransferase